MGSSAPFDIGRLIVSDLRLHSGRPRLAGTGLTVHAVAIRHLAGMSAEQILDEFPHLDLGRIHAALAYYYANQAQIERELEADQKSNDELAAQHTRWTPETDLP